MAGAGPTTEGFSTLTGLAAVTEVVYLYPKRFNDNFATGPYCRNHSRRWTTFRRAGCRWNLARGGSNTKRKRSATTGQARPSG